MTVQLEKDVAVLQSEVTQFGELFRRLEAAVAKIGELATGITTMLARHEERFTAHASADQDLYDLIEVRRKETQDEVEKLSDRLMDMSREIKEAVEQAKKDITNSVESVRKDHEPRISALERWRWIMLGGGMVIGFFLKILVPSLLHMMEK